MRLNTDALDVVRGGLLYAAFLALLIGVVNLLTPYNSPNLAKIVAAGFFEACCFEGALFALFISRAPIWQVALPLCVDGLLFVGIACLSGYFGPVAMLAIAVWSYRKLRR